MYMAIMAARSVQISLDENLLARVDRQPLARKRGRSALIRAALEAYLATERTRAIDEAYDRAYATKRASKRAFEEFAPLVERQAWPEE
jgi:metal-responsive CopG/Arc/MetJ family transcriptional regulator